jgi:hypothetical protein
VAKDEVSQGSDDALLIWAVEQQNCGIGQASGLPGRRSCVMPL